MASVPPAPTLPPCARGLSAADLSAYRDGAPAGGGATALDAHVASCPACRAQLEQFDRLASILRDERAPEPDERLWQAVRRAAEAGSRPHSIRRMPLLPAWRISTPGDKRPLWGSLGALAAVLLLVLGFAQLFALHGASTHVTYAPTATPAPTLTPLPSPTATPLTDVLNWHAVALPQGVTPGAIQELAGSPADGHVAWICAALSANSYELWETADAGLSWHRTATFSPATGGQSATCTPAADETDAHAVAVVFSWGSGEAGTLTSLSYFSQDDGAHWLSLPDNVFVGEVGTLGSTTYAVLGVEEGKPPAGVPLGLVASTDGLRTWRDINLPGIAASSGAFRFWLGAQSDEIVAATQGGSLWRSITSGASWTKLSAPGPQITLGAWVASQHRWIFCGWSTTQIVCSTDLGTIWTPQPTFTYTIQCANCGKGGAPYSSTQPCYPSAITTGGALIAICPTNGSAPDSSQFSTYMLVPDALAWTRLTSALGSYTIAVPNSGQVIAAQLWWGQSQQGDLAVAGAPS